LPYPYERLVIVEGDFADGMEFSGLSFVSEAWFRTWRGEPNDWITVITVHEVAHQWWYAMVGSDSAADPYHFSKEITKEETSLRNLRVLRVLRGKKNLQLTGPPCSIALFLFPAKHVI
jgi:hypothetical protein